MNVAGFRGARFSLPLDFSSANRSVSVFGENASGKSAFTDALEWFVRGRIDHLWREDCKEDALRNVLLAAEDPSEVTVEFSDKTTNTKSVSSTLFVTDTNKTIAFQELIVTTPAEKISFFVILKFLTLSNEAKATNEKLSLR